MMMISLRDLIMTMRNNRVIVSDYDEDDDDDNED